MTHLDLLKFLCTAERADKFKPLKLGRIAVHFEPLKNNLVMDPKPLPEDSSDMQIDLGILTKRHEDALIRRFGVTALNEHFGPGTVTIKKAGEQ